MLDIFAVEPHVVSRSMRGYSVLFYGEPKSGKTTTASKFPKSLIIAFEKGYAAIPGVKAIPVNSWSDFLKVLKQLKDPRAKEVYETIIVDTADIAYDYCEQYICQVEGVDAINKIPFGQGFTKAGKEFDSKLRQIVQMDYGLVLISHATDKVFTDESGTEYNKIVPTLGNKPRLICARLCDIIGYSRSVQVEDGNKTMLFMRGTPRFEAGSRFKYTPEYIEFSYKNLVAAICDAIDKQAAEDGQEFVSDKRQNIYQAPTAVDFDAVMAEFNEIVANLMGKDSSYYGPRVLEIIERHLGKGKKVSECTRDQAQIVDIIVYDLKELK
jgi:DNA polymerase III delta prime subunit